MKKIDTKKPAFFVDGLGILDSNQRLVFNQSFLIMTMTVVLIKAFLSNQQQQKNKLVVASNWPIFFVSFFPFGRQKKTITYTLCSKPDPLSKMKTRKERR
jgi:hypothetical protein